MKKTKELRSTTLYCFSPQVMLATFIIETFLIVYTIWKYKLNTISKLVIAILAFLALFQISEYFICSVMGASVDIWSRVGFVSITLLPPLGIHLVSAISSTNYPWLVRIPYLLSFVFIAYFLLAIASVSLGNCSGNYIIFDIPKGIDQLYALYYYSLLFMGITFSWLKAEDTKSKNVSASLKALSVGYFTFMVPTVTINLLYPETLLAVPSIMCGFAVLLAFILVLSVLPNVVSKRK